MHAFMSCALVVRTDCEHQIVDMYWICMWCAMGAEGAAGVPGASPGAEWLSSEAAREAAGAAAEGDRLSSGEAATSVGVFELLDRDLLESATSSARNAPRPPPLNQEEWLSFLNPEGVPLISHYWHIPTALQILANAILCAV